MHIDPNAPLDLAAHVVPFLAGAGSTLLTLIIAAVKGTK